MLVILGTVLAALILLAIGVLLRQARDRSGHSLVVSVDPNGFMEDAINVDSDQPTTEREPEPAVDSSQVALGWQSVRLSARGRDGRAVVIQRLRVKVLGRSEAARGWYVFPERGGGMSVRHLVADLDASSLTAVLTGESTEQPIVDGPTVDYAFTVSESDVESWELEVFTTDGLVTWALLVDYEIGGRHRTLELRHPHFAVTGAGPGQDAYALQPDGWEKMTRSDAQAMAQGHDWRKRLSAEGL